MQLLAATISKNWTGRVTMLWKLTQGPFLHPQWHNRIQKSAMSFHNVKHLKPLRFLCFHLCQSISIAETSSWQALEWCERALCIVQPFLGYHESFFSFSRLPGPPAAFFGGEVAEFHTADIGFGLSIVQFWITDDNSSFSLKWWWKRETGISRLPSPWACSCSINLARWEPQLIRICRNHCHCC